MLMMSERISNQYRSVLQHGNVVVSSVTKEVQINCAACIKGAFNAITTEAKVSDKFKISARCATMKPRDICVYRCKYLKRENGK